MAVLENVYFTYKQSTGELFLDDILLAEGYSGHGDAKNDPKREAEKNVGCIPRGMWTIGDSYHSKKVGPLCLPLTPLNHDAHGRTSFLIHGDSISAPGTASHGCMIFNRTAREVVADSDIKLLKVIE